MDVGLLQAGFSRLFTIEGTAGPNRAPVYQDLWRAGAFSWGQGDITLIRIPDPNKYGRFIVVDKVSGEEGNPEITLTARYTVQRSTLLRLARKGCDFDVHLHFGKCKDPRNFNQGWEKILILESARITSYGTTDLGALDPSENTQVNEEVPIAGEDAYEVVPISFAAKAAAQVTREVLGIIVCDSVECGDCGDISDGCQVVFAVTKSSDTSPGLPAEVIMTDDGGNTWTDDVIDTLGVTEDPNDIACIGDNVVVVSVESLSLHWANKAQLLAGTATWAEVTSGFVVGGGPRAIYVGSSAHVWIVGAGGYIYFSSDPTSSVEVQDAGVASTQPYNDIHGVDLNNIVAVGDSNAVVYTTNGGDTWQAVTGPAVGVALNTVFMIDETTWWVGTAGGRLYYTNDSGATWAEKSFSGSGTGVVRDIKFVTNNVGYMAHSIAGPAGRIFRTLDGGFSWYIAPESGNAALPTNDYVGRLAVCDDPNVVFGGGLGADGVDGFIVKGAGAS